MPSLITGEAIEVIRPIVERDALGEPTCGEPARVALNDVIVFPGSTSDLDADRPEGVEVAYTLCFPKTFADSLRGCSVVVRGEVYDVAGDPKRYAPGNTPGDCNMTVEVTRTDG